MDTYRVWTIVGDALAEDRSRQFAVDFLGVEVLILAVEEQSRSIRTNEIRERLSDHREAEHRTMLGAATVTTATQHKQVWTTTAPLVTCRVQNYI